jgi:hypothetical protein
MVGERLSEATHVGTSEHDKCKPHSSPASGMPRGRSRYAKHSMSFTTAHSGVICGPDSTPSLSAAAPDLSAEHSVKQWSLSHAFL